MTDMTIDELKRIMAQAKATLTTGKKSTCDALGLFSVIIKRAKANEVAMAYLTSQFSVAGISEHKQKNGSFYKHCISVLTNVDRVAERSKIHKWSYVLEAVELWRAEDPTKFANKSAEEQIEIISNFISETGIDVLYKQMAKQRGESEKTMSKGEYIELGLEKINAVENAIGTVETNKASSRNGLVVLIARENDDGTTDVLHYLDNRLLLAHYLQRTGKDVYAKMNKQAA